MTKPSYQEYEVVNQMREYLRERMGWQINVDALTDEQVRYTYRNQRMDEAVAKMFGKSDVVKKIAADLGVEVVDVKLVEWEPEEGEDEDEPEQTSYSTFNPNMITALPSDNPDYDFWFNKGD